MSENIEMGTGLSVLVLRILLTNFWFDGIVDQVARLQKKLTQEVNLRNALHRGLNRPLGALPRVPTNLPVEVCHLHSKTYTYHLKSSMLF